METLLKAAAQAALPVVRGIGEADLDRPTPCADYTVSQLMNHLFQVVVNFQVVARHETADFQTPPDFLHGEWKDRFETETQRLVQAWASPGALEGASGRMGLPQTVLAQMALLDLTVHAWDLAAATGQPFAAGAGTIESLGDFVDAMGETAREMKVFGAPHQVPGSASPMEKLLARTGRDPFGAIG